MLTRTGDAVWEGGLKEGKGSLSFGNGAYEGPYSFSSRFEEEPGTNPEELVATAHAACFSMAFSATLEKNGFVPISVKTEAKLNFEKLESGFRITKITLHAKAEVPGIENDNFQDLGQEAKESCPISQALKTITIELKAELIS